jgi:hypothetical protein
VSYKGDIALGSTLDFKFTTRRFSTGTPFALAGTPTLAAYPDNSTTEITAGITLTTDFDTRTGLNHVRIVASGANGYAAGSNYDVVITAGTVDSVSVVGEVVGSFSIERTGAALALLKDATFGLAAIETLVDELESRLTAARAGYLDNINNATLAGASFPTDPADQSLVIAATDAIMTRLGAPVGASVSADIAAVQGDTDNIQTRLPVALVGGRMDASVGAMAADVLTAAALAADAVTEIQSGLSTLSAAQVNAEVVDALNVDTYAEPGQGTPAATATLAAKINYLFKAWRNRTTQTATQYSLYGDDATTIHHKATVSDDGTTFDRTEVATGP